MRPDPSCPHQWEKMEISNYSRCQLCGIQRHDTDGDLFYWDPEAQEIVYIKKASWGIRLGTRRRSWEFVLYGYILLVMAIVGSIYLTDQTDLTGKILSGLILILGIILVLWGWWDPPE